MAKLAWKPWHEVVELREDLKKGKLPLHIFAADLYDVAMQKGHRPVYEDPREFFALTYPTYNLRELCKDAVLRLAGKNDKAVRQLELTYGGGKTHTLIALYHLVNDPDNLPDLPAVTEFTQHIGQTPPRARVAALSFDKLDVEKGMEVRGPKRETRWLKQPWSVMAFQLAGAEGLKLLSAEGEEDERGSAPAENLLVELLSFPSKEGLATLILIDEVLMYAREKIGLDPAWRARLVNFFQYLTQAATKVDSCCVVASLLATDPRKSDTLGKEITQELYAIFRREREEGVQPVVKEDVAEVLRRRFFKPGTIRDREAFRPHVMAAIKGIAAIDDQTRKQGKGAEERFVASYPFHPDLTDVFYTKWTALEGFQRTRGILRVFALALREAEKWDQSPLVGANVFLTAPGREGISEATRELTTTAATEEYEGRKQEWTGILEGELERAREIQSDAVGLKFREIEQAVFATFLHSQPIEKKALTRDLMVLIGSTRPDKIELEKALLSWARSSHWLDDQFTGTAGEELPSAWHLGNRPNLKQMHSESCRQRVSDGLVEARLLDEIGRTKSLTAGASAAGARTHNLPNKPRDIEDDGEFHYAILGPGAAAESGKPSKEARKFIDETSGPDKPRVYRNAVVLVVPSGDGLDVARNRIREYLGWEDVRSQLKDQEVDPIRAQTLAMNFEEAKKKIPEAIKQAYSIVITVSNKNDIHAFKIAVTDEPLFSLIKADNRARIQDTAISADALLLGGPYDLWHKGEKSRRVKDLVGAFAQLPHLPKMLHRAAILQTLVHGCVEGMFVLQLTRPDRSLRTWWKAEPDETALKDPGLELVLPEAATLTEISASSLRPGILPGLWKKDEIAFKDILEYFGGGQVVNVDKGGYEEPVSIPKAERATVEVAVRQAVAEGTLWLTSGPASICGEEVPAGVLTEDAVLQGPPNTILSPEILPESLRGAWENDKSTALAISAALSNKAGKNLPWPVIREVIDGACRARFIERTEDSGPWPCDYSGAQKVKIAIAKSAIAEPGGKYVATPGTLASSAQLRPNEIQDLADSMPEITKAAVGLDLSFYLRMELGGKTKPSEETLAKLNQLLGEVSEDLRLQ